MLEKEGCLKIKLRAHCSLIPHTYKVIVRYVQICGSSTRWDIFFMPNRKTFYSRQNLFFDF